MTFCNGRSKIKFTFKGVFCVCSKYNKLTRCNTYLVFLNYKNVGVRLYQLQYFDIVFVRNSKLAEFLVLCLR